MRGSWKAAALAAVLAAGAAGAAARAGSDGEEIEPGGYEFNRFLFFAVLQGACEDALPDAAVKAILEKDEKGHHRYFIYACPICHPVIEGLKAYGMRNEFYYGRKGDPLAANLAGSTQSPLAGLAQRLAGGDDAVRGAAIHDLVERWLGRQIDRHRLSETERAAWRQAMAIGRKKGMERLPEAKGFPFKGCPSCDGATGKDDLWK